MYQPGDIVEIVATEDDGTSQSIAGSIAEIVKQDSTMYNRETYRIRFINLTDLSYRYAVSFWEPKNLKHSKCVNYNITEEDVMALLGGS